MLLNLSLIWNQEVAEIGAEEFLRAYQAALRTGKVPTEDLAEAANTVSDDMMSGDGETDAES